jgi:hypothetical protein
VSASCTGVYSCDNARVEVRDVLNIVADRSDDIAFHDQADQDGF